LKYLHAVRLLLFLLGILCVTSSCASQSEYTTWYGSSDRYGILMAVEKDVRAVVVVVVPQEFIQKYRDELLQEGIKSDTLGAIQHLFGRTGKHFFRGTASQWNLVAQTVLEREGIPFTGIRPSVEALVSMMITHAEHLSKDPALDTLEPLVGVQTEIGDIVSLLSKVYRTEPLVRIYDTSSFLSLDIDSQFAKKWITEWTELVLREAIQHIGENET